MMLNWKSDPMNLKRLKEYEELVGVLEDIKEDDNQISVTVSGMTLEYPKLSDEGQILRNNIHTEDVGRRTGIMQTDVVEKSIVIRWSDEHENDGPTKFWEWYVTTYVDYD